MNRKYRYWIGWFENGAVSAKVGLPWLWLANIVLIWYVVFRNKGSRYYRYGYYDIMDRHIA